MIKGCLCCIQEGKLPQFIIKKPRAFDKNLVLAYDIRLIRDLE